MQRFQPLPSRPGRTLRRGGFGPGFARVLLGLSILMMMVPTFLYVHGELRHPLLTEGDKLVQMACPDCGGQGSVPGKGQCVRCRGVGTIPYLVSGPTRPTQIIGHVYAPDGITPISAASVHIETPIVPIDLKTDPGGKFGMTLPPGNYTVNVQSPTGVYKRPLTVDVIRVPVPADRDLTFLTVDEPFVTSRP